MEIKDCFVIMPFSTSQSHSEDKWTEIFENFFKPAWNAFNIECYRIRVPRGSITKDIIKNLFSASVVFADLTDSNPNVMYELGVRHTFKKPSIMVKAKGSEIPFDVNDYNVFEYKYTPKGLEELKVHLGSVIDDIQKFPQKADNPVWNFRDTSDFLTDYYRNVESIQKLKAIILELNSNRTLCDRLLDNIKVIDLSRPYLEVKKEEQLQLARIARQFFPSIRSDALTHLRTTMYVDFEEKDWGVFLQIDDFYGWCRYYSSNLEVLDLDEDNKERIARIIGTIKEAKNILNARIAQMKKDASL